VEASWWPPRSERQLVIAHIVLFKPKDDLTSAQTLLFAQQLKRTMSEVASITRAQVGKRIQSDSAETRKFGDTAYEYSAVIEFKDEPGLVQYLRDPLHRELGRLFWENCQSTVVMEVRSVDARTEAVVDLLVKTPTS
jgi:Stress responsive A/B Barrel Domain